MKLEIELDVPADVVDKDLEKALREHAVLRLFAARKVSAADAARLLSLARVEFLSLIEQRGIALTEYGAEDFRRDKEDMEAILKDTGIR